jgi:hypothetical protein
MANPFTILNLEFASFFYFNVEQLMLLFQKIIKDNWICFLEIFRVLDNLTNYH